MCAAARLETADPNGSSDFTYSRGTLLPDTAADLAKLRCAWAHIRRRREAGGPDALYVMSGLERRLSLPDGLDEDLCDDEIAAALYTDEVRELGMDHLGGDPARHDLVTVNRTTAGLLLAADVIVRPGQTVLGVSPSYSHPAVLRAVAHAGGRHCGGTPRDAWAWIRQHGAPDVIFLTRLAVTYDILDQHDIEEFVQFARAGSIPVILDDAGGGRVGPVCFGQPRSLELGIDVAVTGLDKYGVLGPRLGLVGGDATIVASIRSRAYEMGLEARQALLPAVAHSLRSYSDSAVRDRVEITQRVVRALAQRLGDDLARSNEIIGFLPAGEIMRAVKERAGTDKDFQIVPYEATAALAMVLLRDYGIMTVHFAGVPPGTADLLIKFLPPDTVARFGGPDALAEAFDRSLDRLGEILPDREATRKLLFDPAC